MTTLQARELVCPVCDVTFRSQVVVSTNGFGGKRTDFHERAAGTQPLPYLIHTCHRCGYTGSERMFTEERDVSPILKHYVWEEVAPRVAMILNGSDRYEIAAKIAEHRGEDAKVVGDYYLHAAWCCVDEGDTEAERYFRLKAIAYLVEALEGYDCIATTDRAVITYLVGELWRRVGDVKKAAHWFDAVPAEIIDLQTQQWILDVAKQQRDFPRDWFG